MRGIVIGVILLAVVAAGGTAFLVKRFLDTREAATQAALKQKAAPTKVVLVAAKDLAPGSPLTADAIRWQPWPEDAIGSTFVSTPRPDKAIEGKFIGTVARRAVAKGTPLHADMVFKRERAGFLSGALEPGMRAVPILVPPENAPSGLILPGDRIDVIVAHDVRKDAPQAGQSALIGQNLVRLTAETVLENVRVLALDQRIDETADKTGAVAKTITIEVTPKQAEMLAIAKTMGKLSVALRSLGAESPEQGPPRFTTDLEVSPALKAVVGTPPTKSKSESAPRPRVKVVRGGATTTQEFSDR